MADSQITSIIGVLKKIQNKFSSTASSSQQFDVPQLNQLNDMVYEVHSPPPEERPELEVIFFHGLQIRDWEHAHIRTWMTRDNSQLWLQTWLAELFPNARIFTISYDSSTRRTQECGRLDMYCTAENLVYSLTTDEVRIGQAGCPVVLVGHCLGGLVVKELCTSAGGIVARRSEQRLGVQRIHNLFSNLRGMFFYGTPHNGSVLGDELHNFFKGTLLEEIETLKASSARRNQEFNDLKSKYGWITAGIGESCETYVESIGKKIHVVPEASSRLYMDDYYSEAADHYNICKPERKNASALILLRDFLNKIKDDGVLQAKAVADAKSSREYVIDVEGRASQVQNILGRPDTNTVFITGLTGIGKTTLAQQVFHDISHNFSVSCFVSLDTSERSSNFKEQVLRKVQEALLDSGFDKGSNHNFSRIPHLLQSRKVLMVLDNVESQDQLRALQTETWLEGSASKLIVTTTNPRLGNSSNTFVVPYLSHRESVQLFRHYAFNNGEEPEDVRHLVSLVINECENLPMSLKILGGFICQEDFYDKQLWLDIVERLRKAQEVDGGHDYRLMAKLRFCYDALHPAEKEMFLDIATFFHGYPLQCVKCIWNGCRESPQLGWVNLERRFLAILSGEDTIWMHRLLRNLGQSIASPQNRSVDKWARISRPSDAEELIAKHQGIVDARALKLRIRENEIGTLRNTTFVNYTHLQYLILEGVRTSSGTMELPTSLVYLRWKDAVFTSCPVEFGSLEKLVVLELIDCKFMKLLPPGVVNARKLTWLDLEGCLSLTELPLGLSRFLQHLGVSRTSLRSLPSDLGRLQAHKTQLTRLPQEIGSVKMLTSLDLSHTRLTTLPESIGDLKQLTDLDLSDTMVTSLPNRIGCLQELKRLGLARTKLASLPESIGGLRSLTAFELSRTCLKSLPKSIGDLVKLDHLSLSRTPLEALPDALRKLRCLSHLDLEHTQISRLPDAMGELVALEEFYVSSRRLKVWSETTRTLSRLKRLEVDLGALCENRALSLESAEFGDEGEQNALALRERQSQAGIHSLLAQLPFLHALHQLCLYGRGFPQHLLPPLFQALQHLPSLVHLTLDDFNHVDIIPSELGMCTTLVRLEISTLERLRELPESLGDLRSLRYLVLLDLPRLCKLPDAFTSLPSLQELDIERCPSLKRVPHSSKQAIPWEDKASQGTNREPLDSQEPNLPRQFRVDSYVASDSWSLLEQFLDCCGEHCSGTIVFWVQDEEMENVRTKAIKREGRFPVLDLSMAMQLVPEIGLHFRGRLNSLLGASRRGSCECRISPRQRFMICPEFGEPVSVRDLLEESGDIIEEQDENVVDPCDESHRLDNKETDRRGVIREALLGPLVIFTLLGLVVSGWRTIAKTKKE